MTGGNEFPMGGCVGSGACDPDGFGNDDDDGIAVVVVVVVVGFGPLWEVAGFEGIFVVLVIVPLPAVAPTLTLPVPFWVVVLVGEGAFGGASFRLDVVVVVVAAGWLVVAVVVEAAL
jgi:hypothetical protein